VVVGANPLSNFVEAAVQSGESERENGREREEREGGGGGGGGYSCWGWVEGVGAVVEGVGGRRRVEGWLDGGG
jgi:hypothetical protein